MLKEFETRKPQYEQLNQAAQGILCAPDDVSPSDSHVRDQHRAINDKWENLTHQLSSRSNQIDQATAKSTEYHELLQRLSDRVGILNHKLNSQSVISTQPDIVKQQLEEISEIRSDLEQQKEQIEEAQNLCDDLSSLIGEQYLKDELRKRLDAVLLPFNGLEERAGWYRYCRSVCVMPKEQDYNVILSFVNQSHQMKVSVIFHAVAFYFRDNPFSHQFITKALY